MNMGRIIFDRIYSDYFLRSRIDEYRTMLCTLLQSGYAFHSIPSLWQLANAPGGLAGAGRYVVLRHDIDLDVATAKEMWAIEKELGVISSYYFRLSTIDIPLMGEIDQCGCDVGYHYEELATYAKSHGLKNLKEIHDHMTNIQSLFQRNITVLRKRTGLALRIAASHGDFMNRKLGITNTELLKDRTFRASMGIDLEAYDEEYRKIMGKYFSDNPYPIHWKPESPLANDSNVTTRIQILIHPGNWRSTVFDHTQHNISRLYEECKYQLICGNHAITGQIKSLFRARTNIFSADR
jgi:hypothetical protein